MVKTHALDETEPLGHNFRSLVSMLNLNHSRLSKKAKQLDRQTMSISSAQLVVR
jgi:hypothetical protein